MNHTDITSLHQEILHGKETAVLFGLSWANLGPDDKMVRLILVAVHGGQVMQTFMHRLTPLLYQPETGQARHESPEDLPIQDEGFRIFFQGEEHVVAQRTSASWSYFSETHEF
jgi:hypothetical protein